ncbi:hypothetical protein PIIN_10676 [Serendipita indica DSM 11827]|uniref:Uncharacterized protein n=1 Tax=Serendipita indica (strain DSM 11827) TaxID=1109443 RepID=G4TZE5_SERID|nr:hypothetical protein PIIN_10676 [Serendipita indica DSM 11827]
MRVGHISTALGTLLPRGVANDVHCSVTDAFAERKQTTKELIQSNLDLLGYIAQQFDERADNVQPDFQLSTEMDALQHSLTEITKELRKSLQSMQAGFQRVLAPVCRINSLPVELMQDILYDANDGECKYDTRGVITVGTPTRAVEFTHVSRWWCGIVSGMPSLWKDVAFSLTTIKECKAREMWSVIAPRTRQSPATIRIQHADSGRLTLAVCSLKDMESIEKLALHVGGSSPVHDFPEARVYKPGVSLPRIRIVRWLQGPIMPRRPHHCSLSF